MENLNERIRDELFSLSDDKYKKFSSALIPESGGMIGVRLPLIRKIAKDLEKEDLRKYLNCAKDDYFEEIMLQGFVIGRIKDSFEEVLPLIDKHISKINNWSLCDSFCASLKCMKNNKEKAFPFLCNCVKSHEEFRIRFGIICMMMYFVDEDYIDSLFEYFENAKKDGYYVKMGAAWAISVCFVKFPEKTFDYLKKQTLDRDTYNMALSKITDSARVDSFTKEKIRKMKIKN